MKKSILLLAILMTISFAEAQMNLNEIANADEYHRVAQIKGSESLLIEYFSEVSNKNDTLYVILCPLMFCPRCEAEINVVQELLYMRIPDNPMVLIASFPNEMAAQKYVANKFYFDDVIYDTDMSFKSFLAFRTDDPRIPFIMKIDRKTGRLLTGGDYLYINNEFADALVRHTEPMPYYGELWEGTISFKPATSYCDDSNYKRAKIFRNLEVPNDSSTIVSNINYPSIHNGFLSFTDELDNSILLYSLSEKADKLSFHGKYSPTESEELTFVSIDHEQYFWMRDNNMALAMCLTSLMINNDTLAFSVSTPKLRYNGEHIEYYNAPAIILQNINLDDERAFIPLNLFGSIDSTSFLSHEGFYYSAGQKLMFFNTSKGYPYFELTDGPQNVFEDSFYDETPLFTVFDNNRKPIARIGQLGQIHKDLHLGYAYCNHKITSHNHTIAVSDGTSGTISVYDDNNLVQPFSTINVFDISSNDFSIDSTLYGTEEYAYQFQDAFQNTIIDILIDSKNIYTLSVEDGCYFKKTFSRQGKLKSTILIPNSFDAYQLEITGLCLVKNKVLVSGFYFDKETHNMVLFE